MGFGSLSDGEPAKSFRADKPDGERDGHLTGTAGGRDRRSRLITITESGHKLWIEQATAEIHGYYEQVLKNFSVDDVAHTPHYLLTLLDNIKRLEDATRAAHEDEEVWHSAGLRQVRWGFVKT